jgi:hypothetical protein
MCFAPVNTVPANVTQRFPLRSTCLDRRKYGFTSRIEKGEDNAKIDTLRGIAAALGCSVVDLLPQEDKKRK